MNGGRSGIRLLSFLKGATLISGVNSYHRVLAGGLVRLGHEVTTAIWDPGAAALETVLGSSAGRIEILNPLGNRYRRLVEVFERCRPHVVLHHYLEAGLQGAAIARRRGHRFRSIYVCHGPTEDHYGRIQAFREIIDEVVAVNSACVHEIRRRFGPSLSVSLRLPAGVGIPPAPPMPDADPLRLLYCGRLEQRCKRVMDLVPLVHALRARSVAFRLAIVGDGPCRTRLQDALTLPEVRFHGRLSTASVQALYARSHVLVLCSVFEGVPVTLLEAMAHGRVPVVTRTPGIEDILSDGVNGLLYTVGGTDQATAHLAGLAVDRDRLHRLGRAARRTVSDGFSAQQMAAIFDAHIRGQPPAPPVAVRPPRRLGRGGFLRFLDRPWIPDRLVSAWRRRRSRFRASAHPPHETTTETDPCASDSR